MAAEPGPASIGDAPGPAATIPPRLTSRTPDPQPAAIARPPAPRRQRLPATVWVLGFVSFCTDLGSEMIVPLLPSLMLALGGGMLQLGLLQGLSDLLLAGLKILSGRWSDRQRRRRPWLLAGYGLSGLMRPLFAVVQAPWQAVAVRVLDRVGKGLRAAPRDALLADAVVAGQRGRAFGLQRALDHAGALAGALLASLLLLLGVEPRTVFALALLPGLASVLLIAVAVREVPAPEAPARPPSAAAPPRLRPFLPVVAFAAVAGGVDLFALARAAELGVDAALLPLLWAVLHLVRSGLATAFGGLSDRCGRRRVLAMGLLFQVGVLLAFAGVDTAGWLWPLFALLGLHAAFTEGAERGLVADLAGASARGAAFGVYHAVHGVAAFAGALLLGGLWDRHGAGVAFAAAAAAAVLALAALGLLPRPQRPGPGR